MASTNQINKVVESIVVLGDLIILNLCLSLLLFFWKKAFINLPFSCTVSFMMASLTPVSYTHLTLPTKRRV